MTQKVRVELNHRAIEAYLKSQSVLALVKARADEIAAAAGPGFEATAKVGRKRVVGAVRAKTPAARLAEARGRALTRALASKAR